MIRHWSKRVTRGAIGFGHVLAMFGHWFYAFGHHESGITLHGLIGMFGANRRIISGDLSLNVSYVCSSMLRFIV